MTISAEGEGKNLAVDARGFALDALAPIQSGIHYALGTAADFLKGTVGYRSAAAESTKLRGELTNLYSRAVKDAVVEQQAGDVLREAHLPFAAAVPAIPAEVLTPGWSNFNATVTINRGASAGIRDGEPVLASGALAGKVVAVSTNAAIVELVTDIRFVVSVRLHDGHIAEARGLGPGRNLALTVAGAQQASNLETGAMLVTSGLAMGADPPGIPVGDVVSAKGSAATVQLRPLATGAIPDNATVEVLRWSQP